MRWGQAPVIRVRRSTAAGVARLACAGRCVRGGAAHAAPFSSAPQARADGQETSPLTEYQALVDKGRIRDDAFQRRIVSMLNELHGALRTYQQPPVPEPEEGLLDARKTGGIVDAFLHLFRRAAPEEHVRPTGTPESFYLYGDVGTGKSMLMDLFYHTLPADITRKQRVHFHQFMIDVHKRSHYYKSKYHRSSGIVGQAGMSDGAPSAARSAPSRGGGAPAPDAAAGHESMEIDPIEPVAREIAQQSRVLCLDEFQVVDIADAMILRRVLERLLGHGVVVVTTSNRAPADLYKNGIQRSSFMPCIHLIETQYRVTDLNSGTDYRRMEQAKHCVYFLAGDPAQRAAFDEQWAQLTGGAPVQHGVELEVWGRTFCVPRSTDNAARLSFMELCGQPRSAADYIALCQRYPVIFVEDIPTMSLEMRDLARRFITFIDAAYESKTVLFCTSETELGRSFSGTSVMDKAASDQMRALMDDLKMSMDDIGGSSIFSGQEELFAFARLLSRLNEMSTQNYHSSAMHRVR
ncbi:peroxisome-assembly ATPase [Malassezia sp. CBS 17886]|nr:peroxisome-assembly ATPase [Malassezia sp. CBS 17886]